MNNNSKNTTGEEGIDFSQYSAQQQSLSAAQDLNQTSPITFDDSRVEGGFLIKQMDKIFGGKANTLIIKIVLIGFSVVLALLAIVVYIYLGVPKQDETKIFVPNPTPRTQR